MISEVNVLLVVVVVVVVVFCVAYLSTINDTIFLSRSRLDQTKVRENGEE